MKDRIAKIIEEEGMTATRFAEEIGVQASSISHIISGRNKPSTDFLIKILDRFRGINPEWLLLGRGSQLKDSDSSDSDPETAQDLFTESKIVPDHSQKLARHHLNDISNEDDVEKIVIFYNNNSFKTYYPG